MVFQASARRVGLKRLFDWILSVMSLSLVPWRLVIGRLGRIGHGELRGWSSLLSRKSLKKAIKQLKVASSCIHVIIIRNLQNSQGNLLSSLLWLSKRIISFNVSVATNTLLTIFNVSVWLECKNALIVTLVKFSW